MFPILTSSHLIKCLMASLCIFILMNLGGCVNPPHPTPEPVNAAPLKSKDFSLSVTPSRDLLKSRIEATNTEIAGVLRRVSLPTHATLGQGFSLVGENLRGYALEFGTADMEIASHNAIQYDLKYVDNYEELARAMKLDARASFSGFSGGMSASLSLLQAAKFSSRKAYIVVHMTVMTGSASLSKFMLSTEALGRLKGNINTFKSMYGDSFIEQIVYGAELCALMEFSDVKSDEQTDLRIDISGHMGGFSAESHFEDKMKKLTEGREVRVLYSQSGAATGREPSKIDPDPFKKDHGGYAYTGGVVLMSPEEFLGRLRDFPKEARDFPKNSAILWGEASDYNVVENLPNNSRIHPPIEVKWALEDLGRVKMLVDQDNDNLTSLLTSGLMDWDDQESATLTHIPYRWHISRELDRIGTALIMYPSPLASISSNKLPSITEYISAQSSTGKDWTDGDFKANKDGLCLTFFPVAEVVRKCLYGPKPFKPVPIKIVRRIMSGTYKFNNLAPEQTRQICYRGTAPNCESVFEKVPHVVATAWSNESSDANNDSFVITVLPKKTTPTSFWVRVYRADGPLDVPLAHFGFDWFAREPD